MFRCLGGNELGKLQVMSTSNQILAFCTVSSDKIPREIMMNLSQ